MTDECCTSDRGRPEGPATQRTRLNRYTSSASGQPDNASLPTHRGVERRQDRTPARSRTPTSRPAGLVILTSSGAGLHASPGPGFPRARDTRPRRPAARADHQERRAPRPRQPQPVDQGQNHRNLQRVRVQIDQFRTTRRLRSMVVGVPAHCPERRRTVSPTSEDGGRGLVWSSNLHTE
jgi:hypothetical protein